MSDLIDMTAVRTATLRTDPFKWGTAGGIVPETVVRHLASTFPSEGFVLTERLEAALGQKRYRTANLPLVEDDEVVAANVKPLDPVWPQFLEALGSREYRAVLSDLTGRAVSAARLEIRAVRYGPGGWIDPHTDRADKLVTQTWYFNEGWPSEWGGQLAILRSADPGDRVTEVAPLLGETVVLVPSERSWHSVVPVSELAAEDRRTLVVHYSAP